MITIKRLLSSHINPYKTLNISPSASQKEIKQAYLKLALKYHPDKTKNNDKFKEIQQAYDILKSGRTCYDAKSGYEYDTYRPGPGQSRSTSQSYQNYRYQTNYNYKSNYGNFYRNNYGNFYNPHYTTTDFTGTGFTEKELKRLSIINVISLAVILVFSIGVHFYVIHVSKKRRELWFRSKESVFTAEQLDEMRRKRN